MQRDVLEPNTRAEVRVYAVWFAMLGGDARSAWDPALLPDARVHHYWDEQRLAGRWFAQNVEGWEGIVWDAYYLYGPDAVWGDRPRPLLSSGSTVMDAREQLEAAVLPWMSP